jgi:predicted N-acetyltransferase YhbS
VSLSAPVPLAEHHELDEFNCSEPSLSDWLKARARDNSKSGASNVFVCCEGNKVLAYYSLSASSVLHTEVPGKVKRNMPTPIPVVLLGRLAVDASLEGKGVGQSLFKDAAHRINQAADQIGVAAIIVHPISDKARAFWLKRGFADCPGEKKMMVVTMKDIRAVIGTPPDAG